MPAKRVAIVRWTGRGRMSDLRSSVDFVLKENGVRARTSQLGSSVVAEGPDPIGAAALLGYMPGASWVAAGMAGSSLKDLADSAAVLGRAYLRSGDRFSVDADTTGRTLPGDLAGAITSRILETVKGARVSDRPKVRFRAAFDGRGGVVGVEVKRGAGGAPTGTEQVACLVSGGVHSSVLAWMSMVQGFRVLLVHAEAGEESLRAVANLYSELSHRGDPRWLGLEVIRGDSVAGALRSFASESKLPVFAGFHSSGARVTTRLKGASAPLYLLPDETFRSEYEALGLWPHDSPVEWGRRATPLKRRRRFGGVTADVSDVIDGLR